MLTSYKSAHYYQSIYYENRKSTKIRLFAENRPKQPFLPPFQDSYFPQSTGRHCFSLLLFGINDQNRKACSRNLGFTSSKARNKSFIRGNFCSISMKLKFQGEGLSETLVSNIIQIWNFWKFTYKPLLIPSRYDPSTYRLFYHKSHTLYLFVRGVSKSPCPRAWRGAAKEQALSIRCLYDWL